MLCLKALLWLFLSFSFFSCEKFSDDELESKEANSTLVVRTRAAADGSEGTVSYPVNVYIFGENDKCVTVSSIGSGDDELSVDLPEGSYDVYAVAGADADTYDLPTKENATKETVISLKAGKKHGDLMTAHNTVTLAFGEQNSLTLSLERKVMLLQSVTISNVPANVTAVSVSISPLYENLLLDGEYSGTEGRYEITLTKDADGTTWKSTEGEYLLEAVGKATVGISFTTTTGKKLTYSYLCPEDLKANHKINISGSFTGEDVQLKGTITGVEWAEDTNITFDFGNIGSGPTVDEGGEETGEDDVTSDDVPQVGKLYKGCYVLRENKQSGSTVYTLMSAKSKNGLIFDDEDPESIKAAVDKGIEELAVSEIGEWRLPTLEEIEYVGSNRKEIADNIVAIRKDLGEEAADILASNGYYFWDSETNSIMLHYIAAGTNKKPTSGASSSILRAFTTITINN